MGILLTLFHSGRIKDLQAKHSYIDKDSVKDHYSRCLKGNVASVIREVAGKGLEKEFVGPYVSDLIDNIDSSFPRLCYTSVLDLCSK